MNNATQYALSEIRARVYPQLLNKAFNEKDNYGFSTFLTTEASIVKNVLNCRVSTDMNILGGQQVRVHTDDADDVSQSGNTSVYTFPRSSWKGNDLISAMDFECKARSGSGFGCNGGCSGGFEWSGLQESSGGFSGVYDGALDSAQWEYDRQQPEYNGGSTTVKMIADNTLAILNSRRPLRGYFSVIVGHDKDLKDINPKNFIPYGNLAVAAVKAYIYINYTLTLGEGDVSRGFSIDGVSSAVQSYADQEELYQRLRIEWGARAQEADPLRMDEFLSSQISSLDL